MLKQRSAFRVNEDTEASVCFKNLDCRQSPDSSRLILLCFVRGFARGKCAAHFCGPHGFFGVRQLQAPFVQSWFIAGLRWFDALIENLGYWPDSLHQIARP